MGHGVFTPGVLSMSSAQDDLTVRRGESLNDFLTRARATIQCAPELAHPLSGAPPVLIEARALPILAQLTAHQAAYEATLVRLVRIRALRSYGLDALPSVLAF